MGRKLQKKKNAEGDDIWNSLHDLSLLLKTFEQYGFGNANIIGKNDLEKFLSDKQRELIGSNIQFVKHVEITKLFFSFKAEQISVIPHELNYVNVLLSLSYDYSEPYLKNEDVFSDYQLDIEIKGDGDKTIVR